MAGGLTDINLFERLGNWLTGARTEQQYIDQQRGSYNQYVKYWHDKELADATQKRDADIANAKQQYAGDREGLANALNAIDSEYNALKRQLSEKYKPWTKSAHFDSDVKSGAKQYVNGAYTEMTNLERARMWEQHSKKEIDGGTDTGKRMQEAAAAASKAKEPDASKAKEPDAMTTGKKPEATNGTADKKRGINNNVAMSIADSIYGKDPSGRSNQLRRQAQMHDIQAADEQKNSQQNFQVANRNARVEADKDAISTAATKNAQIVNNLASGTAAGSAALNRTVEQGDANMHRQRADAQRQEGVKNQREMWGSRQTAEEERGGANITDYQYRQSVGQTAMSDYLSQQDGDGSDTAGGSAKPGKTDADNTATSIGQQCINHALGYTESTNGTPVTDTERRTVEAVLARYPGLRLVPTGTFQDQGKIPEEAEDAYIADDAYGGTAEQRRAFMYELRELRAPEDPARNTTEADALDMSASHTVDADTGELVDQDEDESVDQAAVNAALNDPLLKR